MKTNLNNYIIYQKQIPGNPKLGTYVINCRNNITTRIF